MEQEEQLRRLRASGCDVAQGYLIGSPEPLAAIPERLRGRAGRSAVDGPCALAG